MSPSIKPVLLSSSSPGAVKKWHAVGGAGGKRALLATAGFYAACDIANIEFETEGGVSGGSYVPLFHRLGMTGSELMSLAVGLDYPSLVTCHATSITTFLSLLLRDRFAYTRPKKGVMGSERMGEWIDRKVIELIRRKDPNYVPDANKNYWPDGYWNMAVAGRTQFLFTAEGVWQYMRDGREKFITTETAPLGLTARASSAIPGIIDAVLFRNRHLFDGALSWDGQCPVAIPTRHFGADPTAIIACDVGEEHHKMLDWLKRSIWSVVCGGHCLNHEGPITVTPDGVLMMKPVIWSVQSLQLDSTTEQRWQAVMAGFQEAVIELRRARLLKGDKLMHALSICADIEKLKALAT